MFTGPLPEDRAGRWGLLEDALARWYPPPPFSAGSDPSALDETERRLGLRLPAALREWYVRWGRGYRMAWRMLYQFVAAEELALEDGALAFCHEMCTGQPWAIPADELESDDPPVVTAFRDAEWEPGCERFSSFAAHFVAFNAYVTGFPFPRANGQATDGACGAIERAFPQLPLEPLDFPVPHTRYYGDQDLLIQNEADTWLWVTARTQEAFAAAERVILGAGVTWEHRSLTGEPPP